jgi:FdhD protein/cysteine desulfurase
MGERDMKIEEIDAIQYKDNKAVEKTERVVKDETITLTINGEISRSLSAIEDSLKEFAVGYLFNENMVKSLEDIKKIEIDGPQINAEIDDTLLKTNETVLCSDSAGGWRSKIKEVNPVESDFQVNVHELIDRIEELKDNAEI